MKRRKTLALPQDFLDTITILNVSAGEVLRHFMLHNGFYYAFSSLSTEEQQKQGQLLIWRMDGEKDPENAFSTNMVWLRGEICRIGFRNLNAVIDMLKKDLLSDFQKRMAVDIIMWEWEQETFGRIDFPTEIMLGDGTKLQIRFSFLVSCLLNNTLPEIELAAFMEEATLAYIDASAHHEPVHSQDHLIDVYTASIKRKVGLFGQDIYENYRIPSRYIQRYDELKMNMKQVKEFDTRLAAYRQFYHDWYNDLILPHHGTEK